MVWMWNDELGLSKVDVEKVVSIGNAGRRLPLGRSFKLPYPSHLRWGSGGATTAQIYCNSLGEFGPHRLYHRRC